MGWGPWPSPVPRVMPSSSASLSGILRIFAGISPVELKPLYLQLPSRKPRPCLSLRRRAGQEPVPGAVAHRAGEPRPCRRQHRGCSAHVPGKAAFSRTAQLQPPASKCLGDEIQAGRPQHRRTPRHRVPRGSSLLRRAAAGREAGGLRGAGGAALTSWAVLPHAALSGLQQRGAGSPLLSRGAQDLAHPRLQAPLAAAGPALVGAGAPLAPGPRLARLWGDRDTGRGTVATPHWHDPWGVGCGRRLPWHSRVPGCAAVPGGHCRKHWPLCR